MLHEISFKSFNERDEVQGWVYVPACEPKGIIQLIHGFGEHSRRYFHMIVAFMDAGFIVAADDHVGHGKTAIVNNTWGDWGHKGAHTMMEDEHILTGIVKEMYPNLPYFMFGHSMGSFISLYKIGDMYLHGLYVTKNEKEAFYIFMRCIETMTDEAAYRVAGPVYLRLGRMFLDGSGTERNLKNALICFQKAESFLYDMVLDGEVMYRKSLNAAIKGQQETREKLSEQLPVNQWKFDG